MRKLIVSVAISSSLILVLSACAGGPGKGKQAEGVSGATIKRAAVNGNYVDFGHDVNSVESYDLRSQSASVDNPVASDAQRDEEIDTIVNGISNGNSPPSGQSQMPPGNTMAPAPAVPTSPHGMLPTNSSGTTGSIAAEAGTVQLPALPENVGNPADVEDAAMAAERERLFPKPRWRRELDNKSQNSQSAPAPAPAPASGN